MPFYVGNVISRAAECNRLGVVDTTFIDPNINNTVNTVAVQADNKIVIGGVFSTVSGVTQNRIARLNYDGTLDTTFNTGANIGVSSTVEKLLIQPDQKIVIAGRFTTARGVTKNRIARLNTDGSLDTGFNVGGTVGVDGNCFGLGLQADGKILLSGIFINARGTVQNRMCRLNTDGSLDTSFNTGGTIGADDYIRKFIELPGGQILVGGQFGNIRGVLQNGFAKLNSDGTVDTTFNTGANPGVVGPGDVYDMFVQDDGKIVISGDFTSFRGTTLQFNSPEIARSNINGTRDTTFFKSNPNVGVLCIEQQFDEKIFIGGLFDRISSTGITVNYFARLEKNGVHDTTFNAVVPPGTTAPAGPYVFCSALQDDCRILIGGSFTEVQGITRNRLCRLA